MIIVPAMAAMLGGAPAAAPPTIVIQPQSISVAAPAAGFFSVIATGDAPLTYQWKKNGVNATTACGSSWAKEAIIPPDYAYQGLAYGNGVYVLLGYNTILFSVDGINWTAAANSGEAYMYGVTFGDGKFVAVGAGMSGVSTDGSHWTFTATGFSMYDVAYGNGVFVGANNNSSVNGAFTSPDGVTWTQRSTEDPVNHDAHTWSGIRFANDRFFIFSTFNGVRRVATSFDGITWTYPNISTNAPSGVAYGNGVYVVSGNGALQVATSPDGVNWTDRPTDMGYPFIGVVFDGEQFIATLEGPAGYMGDGTLGTVQTSPDGITWTMQRVPTGGPVHYAAILQANGLVLLTPTYEGVNVLMSGRGAFFVTPATTAGAPDTYSVTVSNAAGDTVSNNATLTKT